MIFKKRIITHTFLIYGYRDEGTQYCLSFMGRECEDSIEFFNLVSRKILHVKELKGLFDYTSQVTKEMGYEKWFMDVLHENRKIAERFDPIKVEKIKLLGFDLLRFYYWCK